MKRALAFTCAALLAACASGGPSAPVAPCVTNDECGSGQLCFAEGCGDPGKGIVVEVGGDPLGGLYARDIPIADGTLGQSRDFELGGPLLVTGEFQREKTGDVDPTNRTFYAEPVLLKAVGQSELIPGISRPFEQRFERPERGRFEMSVGAGRYRLSAWPSDPSVPPASVGDVVASPDLMAPDVTFAFPAVEGAVTLSGRLVKKIDATQVPNLEIALTSTTMDLQAFDPDTREALSQRFPVSSGSASSRGDFTITLGPRAKDLPAALLVATPREANADAPTKTFLVEAPFPNTLTLELGDFGEPFTVKGQVLDRAGAAVIQAQVLMEGTVTGGGRYRSRVVLTDSNGVFTVRTLSHPPDQSLTLIVIPPPMSDAAVTRVGVKLDPKTADPITGELRVDTVTCDQRLAVRGTVVSPDGTPAPLVGVRALEHVASAEPGSERPFPLDPVEVLTDSAGDFELKLDPATWRLEFVAAELPLASRLVTVKSLVDSEGKPITQQTIPTVGLARGRTVSGRITGTIALKPGSPVPYSTLRFFRVTPVEGKDSAILLGSTVADDAGRFTVVLPDR